MKRKGIYIVLACVTLLIFSALVVFWCYPQRIYRNTMIDGVGGPVGFGKRGIGMSMWNWKSSDGSEIVENSISYSNHEEARKDFDEELKTAQTIYQQTDKGYYRRAAVTLPIGAWSNGATIITLHDKEIRHVDAPSLEAALTFERSWLKLDF